LRAVDDWLEQYRASWDGRLGRIALHLENMQRKAGDDE
jgi:hypothetical protein